jgi:hypothetical protein
MRFSKKSMRYVAFTAVAIVGASVAANYLLEQQGPATARAVDGPVLTPAHESLPKPPASKFTSSVVVKLNDLEASNRFREIRILTLDQGDKIPQDQRDAVIAWLELRVTSPDFPAVYALARQYALADDREQAMTWYVVAGLMARIDAARFETPTVNFANATKPFFGDVITMLADPDHRNAAFANALRLEHQLRDRGPAHWLAPGQSRLVDDLEWQKQRTQLRDQMQQMVK